MSENQETSSSASDASEIIQQMQNLVDVESGLAEAHLAVENVDESADAEHFLEEAEKVEGALESAIAPAPTHTQVVAESTNLPQASDPRLQAESSIHDHAAFQSQAATEAQEAIDIVNADIPAPILPEEVAEPAHDVVMETQVEEETSGDMQVDGEEEEEEEVRPRYDPSEPQEPISYDPSEPQTRYDPSEPQEQAPVRYDPSEPQGESARYDPSEPQDAPVVSYDPSVPQGITLAEQQNSYRPLQAREPSLAAATASSPVDTSSGAITTDPGVQQALNKEHGVKPEVDIKTELPSQEPTPFQSHDQAPIHPDMPLSDLPEGITEQSPSVVANKQAAHAWRAGQYPLLHDVAECLYQIRTIPALCSTYLIGASIVAKSTMPERGSQSFRRIVPVL
jgi:hypothetical protein